jgi:antitoxin component of RelBE/YafQ-DinJ toxin-antitoxin module
MNTLLIRLREEDRQMVKRLAEYYGIAEADVIRIALREYAKNHGLEV